jgi:hypothetical protein
MRDAIHELDVVVGLPFADYTAGATGPTIDLAGYSGAGIFVLPGAIAGTHSITVQESADGSVWANVGAGNLIGVLANLSANTRQKVSYVGNKRYIRLASASAGGTGTFGAVVARSHPRVAPV